MSRYTQKLQHEIPLGPLFAKGSKLEAEYNSKDGFAPGLQQNEERELFVPDHLFPGAYAKGLHGTPEEINHTEISRDINSANFTVYGKNRDTNPELENLVGYNFTTRKFFTEAIKGVTDDKQKEKVKVYHQAIQTQVKVLLGAASLKLQPNAMDELDVTRIEAENSEINIFEESPGKDVVEFRYINLQYLYYNEQTKQFDSLIIPGEVIVRFELFNDKANKGARLIYAGASNMVLRDIINAKPGEMVITQEHAQKAADEEKPNALERRVGEVERAIEKYLAREYSVLNLEQLKGNAYSNDFIQIGDLKLIKDPNIYYSLLALGLIDRFRKEEPDPSIEDYNALLLALHEVVEQKSQKNVALVSDSFSREVGEVLGEKPKEDESSLCSTVANSLKSYESALSSAALKDGEVQRPSVLEKATARQVARLTNDQVNAWKKDLEGCNGSSDALNEVNERIKAVLSNSHKDQNRERMLDGLKPYKTIAQSKVKAQKSFESSTQGNHVSTAAPSEVSVKEVALLQEALIEVAADKLASFPDSAGGLNGSIDVNNLKGKSLDSITMFERLPSSISPSSKAELIEQETDRFFSSIEEKSLDAEALSFFQKVKDEVGALKSKSKVGTEPSSADLKNKYLENLKNVSDVDLVGEITREINTSYQNGKINDQDAEELRKTINDLNEKFKNQIMDGRLLNYENRLKNGVSLNGLIQVRKELETCLEKELLIADQIKSLKDQYPEIDSTLKLFQDKLSAVEKPDDLVPILVDINRYLQNGLINEEEATMLKDLVRNFDLKFIDKSTEELRGRLSESEQKLAMVDDTLCLDNAISNSEKAAYLKILAIQQIKLFSASEQQSKEKIEKIQEVTNLFNKNIKQYANSNNRAFINYLIFEVRGVAKKSIVALETPTKVSVSSASMFGGKLAALTDKENQKNNVNVSANGAALET